MGLSNSVGDRHTEFGGGPGWPERLPDGAPKGLTAQERRRAFIAAGWAERRGDVDTGVGVPIRPEAVPRPQLNPSQTANGYADDVLLPGYAEVLDARIL